MGGRGVRWVASVELTCGRQGLLDVSGHLDAAPLLAQHALSVEQESAALDAAHRSPIHRLVLDDVKQTAQVFVRIRQQLERKIQLLLEPEVRLYAVARDADDLGPMPHKVRVRLRKILTLGGTTRCVVLRVKIGQQRTAARITQAKFT